MPRKKPISEDLPIKDTLSYRERVKLAEEKGQLEKGTLASITKKPISVYDIKQFKVRR